MSIPSKKSSISALSNSSGYLFVSRPGIYTFTRDLVKTEVKKFLGVFWGFYSEASPGKLRARPVRPDRGENKNGRNLNFFTGVSEFERWARCASWLQEIPAAGDWELFWEFSGVFKEFRGVWIRQLRTGRRAPGRKVIHSLSTT